jgi:hypothetical protein
MTEHESKAFRSTAWAIAAVIIAIIVCGNVYYALRDTAAIKAGLTQSDQAVNSRVGGYWIRQEESR